MDKNQGMKLVELTMDQPMEQTKPVFAERISELPDHALSRMWNLMRLCLQAGEESREIVGKKKFDMTQAGVRTERVGEFFEILGKEVERRGFDPKDPETRKKPEA